MFSPCDDHQLPFQISNCSSLFGLICFRFSNNFHHFWPELPIDYICAPEIWTKTRDLWSRLQISVNLFLPSVHFNEASFGRLAKWQHHGWGNTIWKPLCHTCERWSHLSSISRPGLAGWHAYKQSQLTRRSLPHCETRLGCCQESSSGTIWFRITKEFLLVSRGRIVLNTFGNLYRLIQVDFVMVDKGRPEIFCLSQSALAK